MFIALLVKLLNRLIKIKKGFLKPIDPFMLNYNKCQNGKNKLGTDFFQILLL